MASCAHRAAGEAAACCQKEALALLREMEAAVARLREMQGLPPRAGNLEPSASLWSRVAGSAAVALAGGGGPGVVVQLCAGDGWLGAALAEVLPVGLASVVVLADESHYGPAGSATSSQAPPQPGTGTPLAVRGADLRKARGVASLLRHVRHALPEPSGCAVFVAERLEGVAALRAIQIFASFPAAALIVAEHGAPPAGLEQHRSKHVVYSAGGCQAYSFAAREVMPAGGDGARAGGGGGELSRWHHHVGCAARAAAAGGVGRVAPSSQNAQDHSCGDHQGDGGELALNFVRIAGAEEGARHEDAAVPPVILFATDQLEHLRESVLRRLRAAGVLSEEGVGGDQKERKEHVLQGGVRAVIVQSDAARFVEGGYAAHHYLQAVPDVHDACFELALLPSMERIGYIAFGAYQHVGRSLPFQVPERIFSLAQVDRLVVLPGHRGLGAKEVLLRCCDAFHDLGYAVRVRTGKPEVHSVLQRCSLLAFESHTGIKTAASALAVVPYDPAKANDKEAFHTLTAVHGKRREKEAWTHWYVATPIRHPHTGQPFEFVGGKDRFAAAAAATARPP